MQSAKRRPVFEAVVARVAKAGLTFEDDPGFRGSVEEWIAGSIEIDELRERYQCLIKLRRNLQLVAKLNLTVRETISHQAETIKEPSGRRGG